MRAALLWTTLLFGAPLPASAEQRDPASETDPGYSRLAEIAARVIDLAIPLLDAATREDFLATLDLAVLRLDFPSLLPGNFADTDLQEISGSMEQRRAEALLEFEAAVGPSWRAELRDGLARASALTQRFLAHSDFVEGLHALTDEGAPTIQQILGDPDRPLGERQAVLQYFRGCLCAGALAAAAARDLCIDDHLAAQIVPTWLDSLEQLAAAVTTGSFQPLADDASLELSPIGALLLHFQCDHGEGLAARLAADPSLAALLMEISGKARNFFPEPALQQMTLRAAWSPEAGAEDPAILVAIHTSQEVADAEASLERFDRHWWLERSLQASTRVVVDIRLT